MKDTDREQLKEQLRGMAASSREGIELDSRERWAVAGARDPVAFFRHLGLLIPAGSILYFEGVHVVPAAASFYEANRAPDAAGTKRETLFPIPDVFHVSVGPNVVAGLLESLGTHPQTSCFLHLKGYHDGKVLFSFHDAFDGCDLLISDRVPEAAVRAFCKELGAGFKREPNANKRDPAVLLALLRALEHPEKVRILWPWWKRALLFWKK
jgi:hypothetical protein